VKAYAAWLQNYKKRQESRGKKRKVSYDAMSNTNKECVKEATMLASMGIQTNPDDNKSSEKLPRKSIIYVVDVSVLSLTSPNHVIMPAPIMSNFPNIYLQLGSMLDCANCPLDDHCNCHCLHCCVNNIWYHPWLSLTPMRMGSPLHVMSTSSSLNNLTPSFVKTKIVPLSAILSTLIKEVWKSWNVSACIA